LTCVMFPKSITIAIGRRTHNETQTHHANHRHPRFRMAHSGQH
jgi:hypothetical protein